MRPVRCKSGNTKVCKGSRSSERDALSERQPSVSNFSANGFVPAVLMDPMATAE